jgi:hypothetical protein
MYAAGQMPDSYLFCGNAAPLLSPDGLCAYGGWPDGMAVYMQTRWDAIPSHLRDAYANADDAHTITSLSEDSIPRFLPGFRRCAELSAFPRLDAVSFHAWSRDLMEYLQGNHIISRLDLDGAQPETLDFRGTGLTDIGINTTGVKEIYLPDKVRSLRLVYDGHIDPALWVHDADQGRLLCLTLSECSVPQGLPCLRHLATLRMADIDMATLARVCPDLETLDLVGMPSTVSHFGAIEQLKNLRSLNASDIFGYHATDFPAPNALPVLRRIQMDSLPRDAAQKIKKLYKPLVKDGFVLDIRNGRSQAWCAENMDNPFRGWESDGRIPRGCAKKAFDAYKKTRAALIATARLGTATEDGFTDVCQGFLTVFKNENDRRPFIDTMLREQIYLAMDTMLVDAKAAGSGLDTDRVLNLVEPLMDF